MLKNITPISPWPIKPYYFQNSGSYSTHSCTTCQLCLQTTIRHPLFGLSLNSPLCTLLNRNCIDQLKLLFKMFLLLSVLHIFCSLHFYVYLEIYVHPFSKLLSIFISACAIFVITPLPQPSYTSGCLLLKRSFRSVCLRLTVFHSILQVHKVTQMHATQLLCYMYLNSSGYVNNR